MESQEQEILQSKASHHRFHKDQKKRRFVVTLSYWESNQGFECFGGIGYEYQNMDEYSKYIGRIIIRYKNTSQILIRNAESVIHDCKIVHILPDLFGNDIFPGYEHVHLNWDSLIGRHI